MCQQNSGYPFRPVSDMSAGCTWTPGLMFTSGLKPSAVRFKLYHITHLATDSHSRMQPVWVIIQFEIVSIVSFVQI